MQTLKVLSPVIGLALVLSFLVPAADATQPKAIRAALQAGGDRLEDLQNADGGWYFDVGQTHCDGNPALPNPSCPNTFGVTALGLVNAYRMSRDADHKAAAADTGNALVAAYNAAPACDDNPATSADRPFTVDVTFLMELSKITSGNASKTFRNTARGWFDCVMGDFPAGADRADNRIDGRIGQGLNNLGAWDAGLDIQAAIDVGQREYALAEALQVIARQLDWDVVDADCPGCELLSRGLLIAAFDRLTFDATVRAAVADWSADLLNAQLANGSWADDTQTTAYVLLGLDSIPQNRAVKNAIRKGFLYLMSRGLDNGGYEVGTGNTTENTEVNGEVLRALYELR